MLAFATYVLLGPLLAPLGQGGLVLSQVLALVVPVLLMCRNAGGSCREHLALSRPSARVLAGAALLGSSFWVINAMFVAPLGLELFGGHDEATAFAAAYAAIPLPLLLVSQALTPAVCEELLFRGAFARALEPRAGLAGAMVVSSLAFAMVHWPLARVLPALATGLVLSYVALASRTTIAAMVVHFLNNAIALTLAKTAVESPQGPGLPLLAGLVATVLTFVGLVLVRAPRS